MTGRREEKRWGRAWRWEDRGRKAEKRRTGKGGNGETGEVELDKIGKKQGEEDGASRVLLLATGARQEEGRGAKKELDAARRGRRCLTAR